MTDHIPHDRLDAYLAGTLAEREAFAVEAHAAACATCEALLDAATRRDLTLFGPTLDPMVRARVLDAVAAHPRAGAGGTRGSAHRSMPRAWQVVAGLTTVAAAAALLLIARRTPSTDGRFVASADATAPADSTTPLGYATTHARQEFAALEMASRELERALRAAPDDAELRAFLSTVEARRAELARRVEDAP